MSDEPTATTTFTMIGSDTAAACEGDACAVEIRSVADTDSDMDPVAAD